MKKRQTKSTRVDVRVDPDQLTRIDALKKRLGVTSRAEVLRRGLPHYIKYLEALAADDRASLELSMSGDEITLDWKAKVIESVENGLGISKSARSANVTRRTVYYQLDQDPVFRQLVEEARSVCVENVEETLYKQATKDKPNITAMLAYLNAHHPDYGMIRTQVLQRVLGPFLDRICRLAEKYVPAGLLDEFVAQLGRDAEHVALEATSGKR